MEAMDGTYMIQHFGSRCHPLRRQTFQDEPIPLLYHFVAYGERGQFCSACMMSDHTREKCALSKPKEIRESGKEVHRRSPEHRRRWKMGVC